MSDDLKRDRNNRSCATLTKHKDIISGPPDTTLSIFTERYPNWIPDEAEEKRLQKEEKLDAAREVSWAQEFPDLPYDRAQSEIVVGRMNTIPPLQPSATTQTLGTPVRPKSDLEQHTTKEIDQMKAIIVESCAGRLAEEILDFEARPDVMGREKYEAYAQARERIRQDMRDRKTPIGDLAKKIALHRPDAPEKILQDHFVELANAIESRLAVPVDESQPMTEGSAGTFQSLGDKDMFDDQRLEGLRAYKPTHRVDIMMHGECSHGTKDRMWNRALSFGEVKRTAAEDLKDSLLGQVMVYVVSRSRFPCDYVTIA